MMAPDALLEAGRPTYSVVIPAHQAEATLDDCLSALAAELPAGAEVLVVDDASTDRTAEIAAGHPVQLLRLATNGGAARARNEALRQATGRLIVFLDADVVVRPGHFGRIEQALAAEPEADAVIGIFAADLVHRNFPSQYKHHMMRSYHVNAPRWPRALFTACGVAPRQAVLDVGLFDESIPGAANEDVELGDRLVSGGCRILFDPTLEVEHRKRYTWRGLIGTQASRAHAMGRLFWRRSGFRETARTGVFLAIPLSFGISLPLAPLVLAALACALRWPGIGLGAAGGAMVVLLLVNHRFLAAMARHGGPVHFVLGAVCLPFDFTLGALSAGLGWLAGALDRGRP